MFRLKFPRGVDSFQEKQEIFLCDIMSKFRHHYPRASLIMSSNVTSQCPGGSKLAHKFIGMQPMSVCFSLCMDVDFFGNTLTDGTSSSVLVASIVL